MIHASDTSCADGADVRSGILGLTLIQKYPGQEDMGCADLIFILFSEKVLNLIQHTQRIDLISKVHIDPGEIEFGAIIIRLVLFLLQLVQKVHQAGEGLEVIIIIKVCGAGNTKGVSETLGISPERFLAAG